MRLSAMSGGLASFVVATSTLAPSAWAQGKVRGMARLGGDFGGDKVLEFQYADGSTPDVQAGTGLLLSAGAALEVFKSAGGALDLQASLGVKYRTIPPATNQEATWLRFPLEGLLLYRTPFGLRVGGGVAVHLGNVFEASGEAINTRVEFKSNPGFVLQAEYVLRRMAFDLRYTLMEYEIASGGSGTVNANTIGGGVSLLFGGGRTRR